MNGSWVVVPAAASSSPVAHPSKGPAKQALPSPRLVGADELFAQHADLPNVEAALRVLIEEGLAKRLGDLVGPSQAAVRFEALRAPRAS